MSDLTTLEEEALRDLAAAGDGASVEEWRVRYLGRKGRMTSLLRGVRDLPAEERPEAGQAANRLKTQLETALAAQETSLRSAAGVASAGPRIDVTLPGRSTARGGLHPITLVRRAMERAFQDMGFDVVEGPEVEWDTYNFDRLRIPKDHPARDMWDTMWIDPEQYGRDVDGDGPAMLMRTHTSPMQIRYMETHQPPIRVIVPGTCYRYEATDATHEWMLTQVEGLVIDEGIAFAREEARMDS